MGKVLLVRGRVDHPERGATKLIAQEVEVFEPSEEEVEQARKQAEVAPLPPADRPAGGRRAPTPRSSRT